MGSTEEELRIFRQRWLDEVSARTQKQHDSRSSRSGDDALERDSGTADADTSSLPVTGNIRQSATPTSPRQDAATITSAAAASPAPITDAATSGPIAAIHHGAGAREGRELEAGSALEYYERAVEKENRGSLGDSLQLYRQAYMLDSQVHEQYREKYFSHPSRQEVQPSDNGPEGRGGGQSVYELSGLSASLDEEGNTTNGDGRGPEQIGRLEGLPRELLERVFTYAALHDVVSFSRLAQVSKRLAYLVRTDDRVWRRLALGQQFGLAGMHYRYACDLYGAALTQLQLQPQPQPPCALSPAHPSYRHMFRCRPRIRFGGCYISTVNYTRPGAPSTSQVTWNSPVLIVTYYRYLRFFRDGSVISLLTTTEPLDVVPHLYREKMTRRHHSQPRSAHPTVAAAAPPPPPAPAAPPPTTTTTTTLPPAATPFMKDALHGRWRLSGLEDGEAEGEVHVETEGVVPKYVYKMQFSLSSAGKGSRNNKLNWKGFWSYNRMTDDWGEFGMKHDRPYYWSRVKSYRF